MNPLHDASPGHSGAYASDSPHQPYESQTAAATAAAALSEQHTSTANHNANGRKRKASAQAGSRGVANLTAEQLSKKRANDREAQRAIRERTRNTIETLAQRIKELESQQPFQELQRVEQERDRALQECEELRRKLEAVASVVSPQQQAQAQAQAQPNLQQLATLTAQQSPLPPRNAATSSPHHAQRSPTSQPYEQQHLHPDLRSPQSASHSTSSNQSTSTTGTSSQYPSTRPSSQYSATHGLSHEQRLPPPQQTQAQSNGERLGLAYVLEPTSHPPTSSPSASSPEKPIYARLPLHSPPTCPLDALLLDFLTNCRQQVAAGADIRDVAGPENPSFLALQDPDAGKKRGCHPISAFLIDILSKYPGINTLPDRAASLYVMFLILRWMVCPCAHCYHRLPYFFKPIKEQLESKHAAWYDHCPWPSMRRRLIATGDAVNLEEFFIPFSSNLSVNWPYPEDQVLTADAEHDSLRLNPVFESHVRDLKNWSVGPSFMSHFGFLVDDTVRIEPHPNISSSAN